MDTIITYILAGVGTGIFGALIYGIRWLIRIGALMDMRSKQMTVLFRVQLYQTRALKATLEAVGRNEINGNVDRALLDLQKAEEEMNGHNGVFAWQ